MILSPQSIEGLDRLEESEIKCNITGSRIGWHVSAIDKVDAIAGGTHSSREIAKRIAIAEAIERSCFRKIRDSIKSSEFLITEFPTSCGFSAGFEEQKTKNRAIAEAVERWVWSKWIDGKFQLPSVKIKLDEVTELTSHFLSFFDSVQFYKLTIDCNLIGEFFDEINIGVVIGKKGGGIFPGSRVSLDANDIWQHASLEAWRHLKIFNHYKEIPNLKFPYNRIVYFGKNGNEGLSQISRATNPIWPNPELRLLQKYACEIDGVFIWRAIMKNFIGWHVGGENRFVY